MKDEHETTCSVSGNEAQQEKVGQNLIQRLKESEEMLCGGFQSNLTFRWHDEVMRQAARDCADAALRISELEKAFDGLAGLLGKVAKRHVDTKAPADGAGK